MRYAFWREKGINPDTLSVKTNSYGKPYVENHDFFYNISHAGDWVVCATSLYDVGVDVECRDNISPELADIVCAGDELKGICGEASERLCMAWTLKESYVKWRGRGFSIPIETIRMEWREKVICYEGGKRADTCLFWCERLDHGHYLSVCGDFREEGYNIFLL